MSNSFTTSATILFVFLLSIVYTTVALNCDEVTCLNGGVCVAYGSTAFCDCSNAVFASIIYAGPSCEYPHTSLCGYTAVDLSYILEHSAFCMNGGECNSTGDNTYTCTCPSGFQGEHCQFDKSKTTVSDPADNFDYDGDDMRNDSGNILPVSAIVVIASVCVLVSFVAGYVMYRFKIQDIVLDKEVLQQVEMQEEKQLDTRGTV